MTPLPRSHPLRPAWRSVSAGLLAALAAGPAGAQLVLGQRTISDPTFGGSLPDGSNFGFAAAGLGDLDGDGLEDAFVGALFDDEGGPGRGAGWVLFLRADGRVRAHQKINDLRGGLGAVLDDDDQFGSACAAIGDRDGDGVPDVVVGAPLDDDGGPDRGAIYVLHLNSNGTVKLRRKIASGIGGFTGTLRDGDRFGRSIAAIGDLNGDGFVDLAVGANKDDDGGTNRGAVWVLFLNSNGGVASARKISATSGNFTGTLRNADNFGTSVASLGDLDGDGVTDLAVGTWLDDDGGFDAGAVWVLFLRRDGTVKSSQKISATKGDFRGTLHAGYGFGSAVAAIGDVNGDGVVDLAVGTRGDDGGGIDQGAVWVLFMARDGRVLWEGRIGNGDGGLLPGVLAPGDGFGTSVGLLGDLDGDGAADLVVGSPGDDDGGPDRGSIHVVFLGRCTTAAAVVGDNPFGTNPWSYALSGVAPDGSQTGGAPVMAGSVTVSVNASGTTGHSASTVLGYLSGTVQRLGGGQVLLVNAGDPVGEILGLPFFPAAGDFFFVGFPVPFDVGLCGFRLYTQGLHVFGVRPFALSNRQVLTLGF